MILFDFVIVIPCFMGVPRGVPPGGYLIIIKIRVSFVFGGLRGRVSPLRIKHFVKNQGFFNYFLREIYYALFSRSYNEITQILV